MTIERATSLYGLTSLVDRLAGTLPSLPGFRSLSCFGSLAEGRADGYSDIDMVVVTDEFGDARAQILGLLELVGTVEFCWTMRQPCPHRWVPTVVFSDEGYYHHLDLSLMPSGVTDPEFPIERMMVLAEGPGHQPAEQIQPSTAYTPEHGSIGHFLLGKFLGTARYLKARKRGQQMMCYRFASATADWCARIIYARLSGDDSLVGRLSTSEYLALDALAANDQTIDFLKSFDFSTPAAMDRAMRSLVSLHIEHSRALALSHGETIPGDITERFVRFMQNELGAG